MERKLQKLLDHGKFLNVPPTRSRTMAAIRGKHTKTTELRLRMALIKAGFKGWRLHISDLPGSPDFYFKAFRLAIFVDGCGMDAPDVAIFLKRELLSGKQR